MEGLSSQNWQPPSSSGSSAITHYTYRVRRTDSNTWSPNWTTVTGGASARSQTVTSLTNNTNYTFELRAVNGEGDGSKASTTATPVSGNTVPGAPRSFTAIAGNTQVTLSWQAPSSDGGDPITSYSYRVRQTSSATWSPNWTTVTGGASARSQTVTGLTNDVSYTFELKAVNGEGDSSSVSATATPVPPFTSVWRTPTSNFSITLPLRSGYNYNFTVDWGDGSSTSTITAHDDSDRTHTYATPGDHTVTISGLVEAWYFNNTGPSMLMLREVTNLGDVGWKNLEGAFSGCRNLTTVAGGDVSEVTNMSEMFAGATSATPDTSGWDTSNVTNMRDMFRSASSATPDTSGWDTSQVTNMLYMFAGAASANPDVSGWNTSQVTDMSHMFAGAASANPDVSGWNTSQVTDMAHMFNGAAAANPDVSGWDTSSVTDMAAMFRDATAATPDMSQWDFRSVTSMTNMFRDVTLPTDNYSAMLNRIVATSTKQNVLLHGGYSKYDSSAAAARSDPGE